MSFRRALVAGIMIAAATAAAPAVAQTVTCSGTMPDVDNSMFTATPIYVTGSSALAPFLNSIGAKLAQQNPPYVILYNNKGGSCTGVNRFFTNSPNLIAAGTTMTYVPPKASASTKATLPCSIGGQGQVGDVVLSDVDATLCPGVSAQAPGTMDFKGPVNDMLFIVPVTSTQQAISAEDAYLMFGMGAAGMVMPWSDPTKYWIRPHDSGTRTMIAANIGIGAHAWQGNDGTSMTNPSGFGSMDVLGGVLGQAMGNPEPAIGILGEDFYDTGMNRMMVKGLAFRAFKQHLAYWPDSTQSATDRKNVREGRYPIWGYVHMIAAVSNGAPTSAAAKYFIDLIQGNLSPAPAFDVVDALIAGHVTPTCAMKVTHDIEGAPQKPYTDPAPCGCYFDSKTNSPAMPASCTACTGDSTCGGGKCRRGFCEAN
jgi:ABC-type phosphate transport system substrate-binding protein